MIEKDQIVDNFSAIGVDLNDDAIEKCIQLCTRYGLSESDIIDTWMAFTVSNNEDLQVTVEALSLMEKKELAKKSAAKVSSSFGKSPIIENLAVDLMDVDVPAQYQTNSSPDFAEPLRTPVTNRFKDARSKYAVHSPRSLFSPSSFSPISLVRSKKYDERTNSGDIICRFGDDCDSCSWKTTLVQPQNVQMADEFNAVPANVSYMFETIADRIQACQKHADIVSMDIFKNNAIEYTDEVNYDSVIETAKYAGRIVCEGNGKVNPNSVLLSYCLCPKIGKNVKLQLNGVPDFSIFPGQVVVVEGRNKTGERVVAEKLFTDVKLPMYPTPREFTSPREPLQMIISAGPYSFSETMSFQPLIDLAKYIDEHKPHVVILIGPIIDSSHAEQNEEKLNSCYPEYYEEILKQFFASIKNVDKLHTKFVLVSHWREVGQRNLYPTPSPRLNSRFVAEMSNVEFMPDPCMLDISGFHVAVTGADILMHLGKEELFCSPTPGVDRLGRVASHLLQQKSFYPLMPPAEELTVDTNLLLKHAAMPFKPHLLVLPSELKCFVKNIYGCVTVNPERLTKGQVGGNFARVEVRSALEGEKWAPESHVFVQILKI